MVQLAQLPPLDQVYPALRKRPAASVLLEATRQANNHGNLIVMAEHTVGRGRVLEMDGSGKIRWQMDNLSGPYDAHLCRNGTVLVVENQNRVTERDRTGKIVGLDRYYNSVFYTERLREHGIEIDIGSRIRKALADRGDGQDIPEGFAQRALVRSAPAAHHPRRIIDGADQVGLSDIG